MTSKLQLQTRTVIHSLRGQHSYIYSLVNQTTYNKILEQSKCAKSPQTHSATLSITHLSLLSQQILINKVSYKMKKSKRNWHYLLILVFPANNWRLKCLPKSWTGLLVEVLSEVMLKAWQMSLVLEMYRNPILERKLILQDYLNFWKDAIEKNLVSLCDINILFLFLFFKLF